MTQQETFKNLLVLKQVQETVKGMLQSKYEETIAPYINIIKKVMESNGFESPFEALKHIKDNTDLLRLGNNGNFLTAAVVDMIEEKHFAYISQDYFEAFPALNKKKSFTERLFGKRKGYKG